MSTSSRRSFAPDGSATVTLPGGQVAHRDHVAHNDVIARRFSEVTDGVWCLVGNGLSNQTFIDAPDGIIAIDTGESTEEMAEAIAELRAVTDRPIVAVLYTHFHYVCGTEAVFADGAPRTIPIWAHERVVGNRARAATEIAPAYSRGLAEQFAILLPEDGPDGRVNVGLGFFYRNPAHTPFTSVFVPPTHTFGASARLEVAGLPIEVTHAPSDADDSVTFWFPTLGVAVNNLVWPVLFNVFAIRGEEYRDPQVLLAGIDHLLSLGADHLVATHGPPISGGDEIRERVTRYRDSIQFLWDQTVRHTNRGATSADLAHLVRLPEWADDDYLTTEHYGVAEHHTRQIRSGLFGFFDGNEANLFPYSTVERNDRYIAALGGRDTVRASCTRALEANDVRWALELSSMLATSTNAEDDDRKALAHVLRTIATRTTSANIRNWCLTRARQWDGSADGSRLITHRFSRGALLAGSADNAVHVLRVLVDPSAIDGVDAHIAFVFAEHGTSGLHVRNHVCVPTNGDGAQHVVFCSMATWAGLLTGSTTLTAALASKDVVIRGDESLVTRVLRAFDPQGFRS